MRKIRPGYRPSNTDTSMCLGVIPLPWPIRSPVENYGRLTSREGIRRLSATFRSNDCHTPMLQEISPLPRFVLLILIVVVLVASGRLLAADETAVDWWGLHGQTTFVTQYHPGFHSAFRGPNSLDPQAQARETWDLTGYGGLRLWQGAELWVNPEVDQGFGLS